MLEKLQMYINGEWVDSHSTETIEVMNPSDDSVLGVILQETLMMLMMLWLRLKQPLLILVFQLKRKESKS